MSDAPTKCERAAMYLYGAEYAESGLSAIDFWSRLDFYRRRVIRDMVLEIGAAEVIEREDPARSATVERSTTFPPAIVVCGFGETREHARRSAAELHRAVVAGTVIVP